MAGEAGLTFVRYDFATLDRSPGTGGQCDVDILKFKTEPT